MPSVRLPRQRRPAREPAPQQVVADAMRPLTGASDDYDALLELVGDARLVLIGEASHGTQEFYAERAAITRRLITEKDFGGVCIEGDWPDAYRVDCYVKGDGTDASAEQALQGFQRFPTWMWRNHIVCDFVEWLRARNEACTGLRRAGFYGLDLYSMFSSIEAVLAYLRRVDPDAAERARHRYACFEHFGGDSQRYGYVAAAETAEACEQEAVRQLVDIRAHALDYVSRDGRRALDDFFSAEQNARLVQDADHYYSSMFRGRVSSWNLRDRHMADTMEAIARHLNASGRSDKLVVWAHNSHLGDARFTDMARRRELNLGQLARERHGHEVVRLIGFSTNTGTVTAAHDWDEPGMRRRVRRALPDSFEHLFAETAASYSAPNFWIPLRGETPVARLLEQPRLQRAIGVIYRTETERQSHYYDVALSRQFDAMIHLDETTALRGLEPGVEWHRDIDEPPETFPTGM